MRSARDVTLEAPGASPPNHSPYLRLLLLQVLQTALQIIVRRGLGLQIGIDLSHLLADDVRDVTQRLLGGILGDVPLEAREISGQFTCRNEKLQGRNSITSSTNMDS